MLLKRLAHPLIPTAQVPKTWSGGFPRHRYVNRCCLHNSRGREMAGVAITRMDMSAADLRAAAKRSANARGARSWPLRCARWLQPRGGGAALRDGPSDVRDWVHRYNEAGLDGLADRARSGRPASLSWVEQGKFASWVEQGADLARDGVVRFRRADLRDRIAAELASPCTNAAWASCFGGRTSVVSPFARSTRNPIQRPRRLSKKLRRLSEGGARRAR